MNVSSECVDSFHHYNQLELLLLILVCIHMSCFIYFGKNVVPLGHVNSFWLVLEVMENDFPKRVVTLTLGIVLSRTFYRPYTICINYCRKVSIVKLGIRSYMTLLFVC